MYDEHTPAVSRDLTVFNFSSRLCAAHTGSAFRSNLSPEQSKRQQFRTNNNLCILKNALEKRALQL